ncbi:hypothetical protein GIB67_042491 [Kingdonia uniflora]|uniref:No apical meristem-associated C-terminal domain-containing protein n=1 Tax=Kingdonia uniflora TaxID=39325 RepID=A0A7J7M121_9MAGN|nr:hypothetical protein GIB67_042491 [Kingdonia uniflora]
MPTFVGVTVMLSCFNTSNLSSWTALMNYLFHGESTQHSQSDTNALIPVAAAVPQKEKGKGRKKRAPAKQRPSVQIPEDSEFLDETDDAGMHWTDADFTCLARAWITTSVQINGRTNSFTFYQKENDAHKIYKGLNGINDFKHREMYKILAREPRWDNLRDDRSNNLSEDSDGPPTSQSAGPNSDLDGSLYEGGSRLIDQKLYRKNLASQKVMEGVTASGSDVQKMLDELRLEKIQAKVEKERRRAEAMQHWQAKMDLEQAKKDHKIMDNDLSTLSGHQLQYYLQR